MAAMTDEESGLPTDLMAADGTREVQTSITNIGAYLWSTVGAEQAGIIGHDEAVERLEQTHLHARGDGAPLERPVLQLVRPPHGGEADRLAADRRARGAAALVGRQRLARGRAEGRRARASRGRRRGRARSTTRCTGASTTTPRATRSTSTSSRAPATSRAATTRSSPRAGSRPTSASRSGEIPAQQYFGPYRSFPDTCDWSWTETRPVGYTRTYYGRPTYDGALQYAGMRVTPSWGGSMFEALMPSLFLPEEEWAPGSWGANHPLTVAAQIHHGMEEAGYGYWGFSPSANPDGGYSVYGVDGIGSDPNGYPSSYPPTLIDHGWPGCPGRPALPGPAAVGLLRTASSHRTRRSSRCSTRATRRWPTSAGSSATSPGSTASSGSRTRSTSTRARRPAPTCRSTRAWRWRPP